MNFYQLIFVSLCLEAKAMSQLQSESKILNRNKEPFFFICVAIKKLDGALRNIWEEGDRQAGVKRRCMFVKKVCLAVVLSVLSAFLSVCASCFNSACKVLQFNTPSFPPSIYSPPTGLPPCTYLPMAHFQKK